MSKEKKTKVAAAVAQSPAVVVDELPAPELPNEPEPRAIVEEQLAAEPLQAKEPSVTSRRPRRVSDIGAAPVVAAASSAPAKAAIKAPLEAEAEPAKAAAAAVSASAPRVSDGLSRRAPVAAAAKKPIAAKAPKKKADSGIAPRHYGAQVIAKTAAGFAAAGAVITGLGTYFKVDGDIVIYAAVGAVLSAIMILALVHVGLIYGWSRQIDGRPLTKTAWWTHAWDSWSEVIAITVISTVYLGILAGVSFAVWLGVDKFIPVGPGYYQPLVLGAANAILAWLALGVLIARRIGVVAIALGGYSAPRGYSVGWRLFRGMGGHMVTSLLESLILRLVLVMAALAVTAGLVRLNTVFESVPDALWVGGGSVVMIAVVLITLLVFDTRLWLERYRHWAPIGLPDERLVLLTGKTSQSEPATTEVQVDSKVAAAPARRPKRAVKKRL